MRLRGQIKLITYQPVIYFCIMQFFTYKIFQADFNLAVYFSIVEKIHYQFISSVCRTRAPNPKIGA